MTVNFKRVIQQMKDDARDLYGEDANLVICQKCNDIFVRPDDLPPHEPARLCPSCGSQTSKSTSEA